MALTSTVMNMNGSIVSEMRGGTQRFFTHDALGSVVEARNSAGAKTDSYTYWPYGEIRLSTGSTVNPWRFCGAWGYYFDGSSYYVRARQYRPDLTRWWTVDPLWPSEPLFEYAGASPTVQLDASGMDPCIGGSDQRNPPDCTKCKPKNAKGPCKAVWITCFVPKPGKNTAVYCDPLATCEDDMFVNRETGIRDESGVWHWTMPFGDPVPPKSEPDKRICRKVHFSAPCGQICRENGKPLAAPPSLPRGTTVCVPGFGKRKINDCGCGQQLDQRPVPNSWMDIGFAGCTDSFPNHWVCICPC